MISNREKRTSLLYAGNGEHQTKNVIKILLMTGGMAVATVLGMRLLDNMHIFIR
jgi:hypothetical protein